MSNVTEIAFFRRGEGFFCECGAKLGRPSRERQPGVTFDIRFWLRESGAGANDLVFLDGYHETGLGFLYLLA